MYCTTDTRLAKREVEKSLRTVDLMTVRLNAMTAAASLASKVAAHDAIRAAQATIDTYVPWLLEKAAESGEDFVTFSGTAYDLCYELEDGRWEGFTSRGTQTDSIAS
jgi:hypothetical protein